MLVKKAEIPSGMIDFDGGMILCWNAIVIEAEKHDALERLVAEAEKIYDVPELRESLAGFLKWKTHADSQTIADTVDAPAPGLWERARVAIIAWSTIALAAFAFIGIVARHSRLLFLGLPATGVTGLFRAPEEAAWEGLVFFGQTVVLAAKYLLYNPVGTIIAVVIGIGLAYLLTKQREVVKRLYIPIVVVPVVVIGALIKSYRYDVPTWGVENVLVDYSLDARQFEVPSLLAGRVDQLWRGVVCSRIANEGGPRAQDLCGNIAAGDHLQNVLGAYLLNFTFTVVLCIIGIAAVRKLVLPSRHPAWNIHRWKWGLIVLMGAALIFAVLSVPATYARTVAPTDYPQICSTGSCVYRMCADERICFDYDLDVQEIDPARQWPGGSVKPPEDVLRAWLTRQLSSNLVDPPKATRFGGESS